MLSDQVPSKSIPMDKPQIFMMHVSKLYNSFLGSDSIFFTPVHAEIRSEYWPMTIEGVGVEVDTR